MSQKIKKSRFLIRRIKNCNPRSIIHSAYVSRKIWRVTLVFSLAVLGLVGLLVFSSSSEDNTKTQSHLLSADASSFLGVGFEDSDKANFSGENPENAMLEKREGYKEGGVGIINAIIYNIKDYFKYIAGGMAVLYLLAAATQLVLASDDEGIQKGKKNIQWSIVALLAVFVIDVMVIAFFEGGDFEGAGDGPGQSLVVPMIDDEGNFILDENNKITYEDSGRSLMRNISKYFQEDARTVFKYLKTVAGAVAIIFIFLAGTHMISASGNEENIDREKKYLMHAITAFLTLILLDTLIFDFIYPAATTGVDAGLTSPECVEFMQLVETSGGKINLESGPEACQSAAALGREGTMQILGIVRFFESFIGGIAVFFIVYAGVQIISSFGNEEIIEKNKKSLLWSVGGLAVVLLSRNLITRFFFVVDDKTGDASTNVEQGIIDLTGVTNFLATFVGVFSVISIIIAGIIWVANFGNTEIAEKAKKIILGAVIGVVISISAYAIVNTLVAGNS